MFGKKAAELIKELDRSPDILPPYNDELIRQVLSEIKVLYDQNIADVKAIQSGTLELYPTVQWRHCSNERNRRCLLSYLYNRLLKIKSIRWDIGSVIPPNIKVNLSQNECNWFQNYNANLTSYMRSIGGHGGLDLTQSTNPPKSLYVEVRCLVDYGEFETEDGAILILKKGSMHFLQRSEAEQLIREGVLEHVLP